MHRKTGRSAHFQALTFILVQILSLGILVLGFEGVVRLFGDDITELGTSKELVADNVYGVSPAPRPGASGTSNGVRFDVASFHGLGFWKYDAPPDTAKSSWLFLGDSVTMGIGIDPDSTFAGRFAADHPGFNVLNPSVVGYSLRDYHNVIRTLSRPDSRVGAGIEHVVLFWCLNDLYFGAQVRDTSRPALLESTLGFLRRHARSYQFLKARLTDRPGVYLEHDAALYSESALEEAGRLLKDIGSMSEAAGWTLHVVLLPYEAQLRPEGDPGSSLLPQRQMTELLSELGLEPIDVAPALRVGEPRDFFLYGDGIHLSNDGHRAVHRAITPRLPDPSL